MLSGTAEYALRIMISLTEAGGDAMTSGQIAAATKVPGDYALKILRSLGRAGLVGARRGRGGGFRLGCDPKKTSLLDVVNVIEPLERIRECPLGREAHRSRLCPLHRRLDELIAMLQDSLADMSLQGVVQGQPGPALCPPATTRLRVRAPRRARS
jgi:Rrf2 family protein